jgi:hypothetical protein
MEKKTGRGKEKRLSDRKENIKNNETTEEVRWLSFKGRKVSKIKNLNVKTR